LTVVFMKSSDYEKYPELREERLGGEIKFKGRVINVEVDDVRLSDGTESRREVVRHSGGVTVLPIDGEGNIIMVRQWRYPMGKAVLELPAGKLEPGEDPYNAGLRELKEETGYAAGKYTSLGMIYASPGYCSEKLYLFMAEDLLAGETDPDEGEILNVEHIPFDEVVDMILADEIHDSKTIAAVLKAKSLKNK